MNDHSSRLSLLSAAIYLVCAGIGIVAFLYPFFQAGLVQTTGQEAIRSSELPWMASAALGLCVLALIFEIQGTGVNTRLIALLGMLVAVNSTLRFLEVALPGPGGFSPIFFLILMVGYVFGGRFGFLMGAMTLLVSSLVTGGFGPWLPGQMFTAGWVGMSAPLARPIARALHRLLPAQGERLEVGLLCLLGAGWGLLYGAIMNLWAWPFLAGPTGQYWTPGISASETLARYLAYYLVTSLTWDLARSFGNVLLLALFGAATLRALQRFRRRFTFVYQPESAGSL